MLLLRRRPRTVYRHPVNAEMFNTPSLGAQVADGVTTFLGSWKFIALQTVIVIVWIVGNVYLIFNFDPYPFILLNLAFSTQAAYAAPLILLAQNRQADRDKTEVERDREMNARSLADTEYLAREIASLRLALEQKADREDLTEPLERLTQTLERLHGVSLSEEEDPSYGGDEGYSAESSHQ